MRKLIVSIVFFALMLSTLTACSNPSQGDTDKTTTPQGSSTTAAPVDNTPKEVTVTSSDGKEVTVTTHPKTVAIYDYSILDILNAVGFDKTGITTLIVPSKDSLPEDLSFYKEQSDDKVLTGGSLFYVDWDVLDLATPDLVVLGARSFGTNAAGDRISGDEKTKFENDTFSRYADSDFIKLSVNSSNSQLLADMENNVAVLAAIFPQISKELNDKFAEIKSEIAAIKTKAEASGKTALFAMMVDQTTLSVFNPTSRFDMLYEEFGFKAVDDQATDWGDQHGFDVRAEYVLEKNPDVIFVLDRSATVGTGAGMENFLNDPIIKQTKAVESGDVYALNGNAWYTMTGGFSSAKHMIEDINQFISKLG